MNHFRNVCFLISLLTIASCSGGNGGPISNLFNRGNGPTTSTVSASQVETQKLVNAVQAEPIYKINDSEIEMLKTEGIITDQDQMQLKTIQ